MKYLKSGRIAAFLAVVLLVNVIFFGLGNLRAEAGIWDDYKGSIITVAKGFLLLWVINLMRKNATGDGGDDLITSTIKRGLNLDNPPTADSGSTDQQGVEPETGSPSATGEIGQDAAADQQTGQAGEEPPIAEQGQDTAIPTAEASLDSGGEKEEVVIIEDLQDEAAQAGDDSFDSSSNVSRNESSLLELVNQARVKEGLPPLEIDRDLVEIARKKARDMIDNNYFDHQSPTYGSPFEMLRSEGIEYSLAGENLAGAGEVEEAFNSLMASPDHRDNILKERYDRIGVGILEGGPYGLMIVQLFLDSPDPAR